MLVQAHEICQVFDNVGHDVVVGEGGVIGAVQEVPALKVAHYVPQFFQVLLTHVVAQHCMCLIACEQPDNCSFLFVWTRVSKTFLSFCFIQIQILISWVIFNQSDLSTMIHNFKIPTSVLGGINGDTKEQSIAAVMKFAVMKFEESSLDAQKINELQF